MWSIDSFDQWGVEFGKTSALELGSVLWNPESSTVRVVEDSSTEGLIRAYRRGERGSAVPALTVHLPPPTNRLLGLAIGRSLPKRRLGGVLPPRQRARRTTCKPSSCGQTNLPTVSPFERGASFMHSIRASITESGVDTPRMSDESSGAGESREAHASSTPRKRVLDEMIMRH